MNITTERLRQLFWTKREKEFYRLFHFSARMQRAVRKQGIVDIDGMMKVYKIRLEENKRSGDDFLAPLSAKINERLN